MYDGDQVQTEISLSETALEALAIHKLNTKQISRMEIQLSCRLYEYRLTFKYPVDYNQISIKLRKISITSRRISQDFDEEKPLFSTIPDHQLPCHRSL